MSIDTSEMHLLGIITLSFNDALRSALEADRVANETKERTPRAHARIKANSLYDQAMRLYSVALMAGVTLEVHPALVSACRTRIEQWQGTNHADQQSWTTKDMAALPAA